MSGIDHSPIISILMGVYNCEKYLGEVIESLLAQTLTDFELIIVDDGSTDRSGNILERYAAHDKRIHVITQENEGVGRAVNNALQLARGRYIARSDADDFSYPERLEKQLAFMESNPDVVMVGTSVMWIDPLGIPIGLCPMEYDHELIEIELLKGNGSAICQPSVMIRTDVLKNIGGYDNRWRVTEDLDLFLRLAEVGRLTNMREVLVNWRQHLASTNHSKREQQLVETRALLEEAHQRRSLSVDMSYMNDRLDIIPHAVWLRRWGWNALAKGRRKDALRYVLRSLLSKPFSWENYKLFGCILRGR